MVHLFTVQKKYYSSIICADSSQQVNANLCTGWASLDTTSVAGDQSGHRSRSFRPHVFRVIDWFVPPLFHCRHVIFHPHNTIAGLILRRLTVISSHRVFAFRQLLLRPTGPSAQVDSSSFSEYASASVRYFFWNYS